MGVPGLRPKYEVRAKVRVGEKRTTVKNGREIEYPASVDHFLCDDEDFNRVCGPQPKRIEILLPFEEPEANFSTGLEQWAGQMLVCYSKDEKAGQYPVAWRKRTMKKGEKDINLLADFHVVTDRVVGQDRAGVHCLSRDCPVLKRKECKPMGRLQFFLPGVDPARGVYQVDTKSWNAIERIEGLLSTLGDPRGRPLTLVVDMWGKGRDRYPVVGLEVPEVIVTAETIPLADAIVALRAAYDNEIDGGEMKVVLAELLDQTTPGWRDSTEFIAAMKKRIEEIGPRGAAQAMLKKYEEAA